MTATIAEIAAIAEKSDRSDRSVYMETTCSPIRAFVATVAISIRAGIARILRVNEELSTTLAPFRVRFCSLQI